MAKLAEIEWRVFTDVDDLGKILSSWTIESTQIEGGVVCDFRPQIAFPDLIVARYMVSRRRIENFQVPTDMTCFGFVLTNREPPLLCGIKIPNSVLVIVPSVRDYLLVAPTGYDSFEILISNELIVEMELLPERFLQDRSLSKRFFLPLANPDATRFRNWLSRTFSDQSQLLTFASDPFAASQFRDCFLHEFGLLLTQGLNGSGLNAERVSHRYGLIRRTLDVMHGKLTEPTTIQEMANELSVRPRLLQSAFADVLEISPYQYFTQRRLHAIRRELLEQTGHTITVTSAAMRYGFNDLGRFSRRYCELFGELPSETLRSGTKSSRCSL